MTPKWQRRARRLSILATTGVCLAFVFSTGPQIQSYLLSLLNSDVLSVYDSIHQQGLVEFPSLASWLEITFNWQFLVMGLVVAWYATRHDEPRSVAWNAALSTAIVLMVFDTATAFQQHQVNAKWFAENSASNIFGSVFCAALVLGIFSSADFVQKHVPGGATMHRTLPQLIVLLGGLLYCCAAYYVSGLFYAPLPARFDISISAPASGATSVKELRTGSSLNESDRPFAIAPKKAIRSNVTWQSPLGKVAIRAKFSGNQLPQVEVRPVSGCISVEQLQKLESGTDAFVKASDVSSMEIIGDTGMTDFMTVFPSDHSSSFKLDTGATTMFYLDEQSDQKSIKITQFVDQDALLEVRSNHSMKLFLGIPLLAATEKKVALAPRLLTVRIGGSTQLIRFWPPKSIRDVPMHTECGFLKDLRPLQSTSDGDRDIQQADAVVGVLVSVTQPVDTQSMSTDDVGIRINSAGGWVSITDLKLDDLHQEFLGRLSMLQVRGNVSDFTLDDVPQASRQVVAYTAVGDLQAEFAQGKLRVWGQAKRLWKDQGRLNATKWEKLSWEPKLFIVSLFLSTVGLLCSAIARRLSANQKFSWINS